MIPSTEEIARQIAVMLELYPDKTTSEIAHELAYSPLFIINAISRGVEMKLFYEIKEDDKLIAEERVDYDEGFGAEIERVYDEILRAITNANKRENDIEIFQMKHWLMGVRPSATEIAIHVLKQSGIIASYKMSDPGDKKSEYEFLTLRINAEHKWGGKQFDTPKPTKGKKPKKD